MTDSASDTGHPSFLKKIGKCEVNITYQANISVTDPADKGDHYLCSIDPKNHYKSMKLSRKMLLEEKAISDFLCSVLDGLGMKITAAPGFDNVSCDFCFRPVDADKKFNHVIGLYTEIAKALDDFAPLLPGKVQEMQQHIENSYTEKLAKTFKLPARTMQEIVREAKVLEQDAYRRIRAA